MLLLADITLGDLLIAMVGPRDGSGQSRCGPR